MAKVSKINIAITGDSRGLASATDAATRELRRLEAQTERTTKRLGAQRQQVNQAAEAMAKLGASNKALGAVGGILGLAQVGVGGGAGGIAIAGGAVLGGTLGAISAAQQINDIAARARKAIDETAMDGRKRIEEAGFSAALAQAIVSQGMGVKTAGQSLGVIDSFFAGLAATRAGAVGGQLLSSTLPAGATMAGSFIGGGGAGQSAALGASQMMSGNQAQDALTAYHLQMATYNPMGPAGYLFQLLVGD